MGRDGKGVRIKCDEAFALSSKQCNPIERKKAMVSCSLVGDLRLVFYWEFLSLLVVDFIHI